MHRPTLEELRQLSVEERLQLVDDIWTTLDEEDALPLPKWQEEELERRLRSFEENPNEGIPWEEFLEKMRGKLA